MAFSDEDKILTKPFMIHHFSTVDGSTTSIVCVNCKGKATSLSVPNSYRLFSFFQNHPLWKTRTCRIVSKIDNKAK